jgi:hypothetical protein
MLWNWLKLIPKIVFWKSKRPQTISLRLLSHISDRQKENQDFGEENQIIDLGGKSF